MNAPIAPSARLLCRCIGLSEERATPLLPVKGSGFDAAWCVSGLIWAPGRVQPGTVKHGMMSYMDVWPTTTAMAGLKVSSNGEYAGNDGKPIFFDGIDNSGYATGKAKELARTEMIVAVSYGLHGSKITKIER